MTFNQTMIKDLTKFGWAIFIIHSLALLLDLGFLSVIIHMLSGFLLAGMIIRVKPNESKNKQNIFVVLCGLNYLLASATILYDIGENLLLEYDLKFILIFWISSVFFNYIYYWYSSKEKSMIQYIIYIPLLQLFALAIPLIIHTYTKDTEDSVVYTFNLLGNTLIIPFWISIFALAESYIQIKK